MGINWSLIWKLEWFDVLVCTFCIFACNSLCTSVLISYCVIKFICQQKIIIVISNYLIPTKKHFCWSAFYDFCAPMFHISSEVKRLLRMNSSNFKRTNVLQRTMMKKKGFALHKRRKWKNVYQSFHLRPIHTFCVLRIHFLIYNTLSKSLPCLHSIKQGKLFENAMSFVNKMYVNKINVASWLHFVMFLN